MSSIVEDEVAFGPENLGVGNLELRTREYPFEELPEVLPRFFREAGSDEGAQ